MEDIVTMFDEADQAEVETKKKVEKEAAEIQEVRRVSLESFKESREREHEQPKKKKRTSSADAISFIKETIQVEGKQKESEWKK